MALTFIVDLAITSALCRDKHSSKNDEKCYFSRTSHAVPRSHISHERRVLHDVTASYVLAGGKLGRPVRNDSKSVKVYLRIGLIKLDLDEKEKLLTLATWTSYVSIDYYVHFCLMLKNILYGFD